MLQHTNSLTNREIFVPASTGAPRYDLYTHLSNLPQSARRTFEEHAIVGNLIIRIEPDLETSNDEAAECKIVSIPYAERKFGNLEDAVEFIRCVKLIAGSDARAFNLQSIASHYYMEAKSRSTGDVLKDMALLALQLSAVTATEDERLFDDPYETETHLDFVNDVPLSESERRAEFFALAARVLGETEDVTHANIFDVECRAVSKFRSHASGFVTDEYAAYLFEQEAQASNADEVDALYEAFESVYEQYDEDHVVSLHMSDGEFVRVAGSLDDDTDAFSLPEEARHLARKMYDLYTNGFPLADSGANYGIEGVDVTNFVRDPETRERIRVPGVVYGLDTWLDAMIDGVYSERVFRTIRKSVLVPDLKLRTRKIIHEAVVPYIAVVEKQKHGASFLMKEIRHRIVRQELVVPAARWHEQTEIIEVCPHSDERERTRAVIEVLLGRLKESCHTRALNTSVIYRETSAQIRDCCDTAALARIKKQAWDDKEQGRLSLKLFTALMTQAGARQARLEGELLRETRTHRIVCGDGFTMTQTFADGSRSFVIVQPLMNRIASLNGKTINEFAAALTSLPRQEKERVRCEFQRHNPHFYTRVRDGLRCELEKSSDAKLRYFRWAFYTGNRPEHPFHTLTSRDQAAAWELLKTLSSSRASRPANTTLPLPFQTPATTQRRPQTQVKTRVRVRRSLS